VEELLFLLLPQPATASAAQRATSGIASLACTFDSLVGSGVVSVGQPIPRASYAAIKYLVRAPAHVSSGVTGPNPAPRRCVERNGGVPEKRSSMSAKSNLCVPALAVGALALAVGGCGSKSNSYGGSNSKSNAPATTAAPQKSAPGAAGEKLQLSADKDGGLYFEPKKLSAKAGAVTFVM